jgi:WS/DGAT/MGAT family acyltransferase
MYVIEGLDSFLDLPKESFALLFKIHHAAIEVEHGYELTGLLHDLTADIAPAEPLEPWFPEAPPSDLALLARAVAHTALFPFTRLWPMARAVAGVAPAFIGRLMEGLRQTDDHVVTRFNSVVSPHRVFDTRRFPMEEFAPVQALARGATLDDAAFAICGGALRRYLDLQDELPEASLVATAPAPTNDENDDPHAFSWIRVRLGTDIADPIARLESIRDHAAAAKAEAIGADLTDVARYAPAPTIALTSKMLAYTSARLGRLAPAANCTIAHVPGPEHPLYLVGARMTYYSAILPISDGMGLVFALTKYDDKINLSFTACYEQLPDPDVFAQCMRDSFQEYLAIARAREAPAEKPKARRRKPAKSA